MNKFFLLLLSVFVFHTTIHAADKIRIGTPPDPAHLTFRLAQKVGFLKAEGFDAEIITIAGAGAAMALASGDLGYFAGLGILRSIIQGLPLKLVACFRPFPHFILMSRSEIKSVQELKGKAIGVMNFGGGADLIGRMILSHFGLDPQKDVRFVAGGGSESRLARMQQGLLDATLVTPPSDFYGKKLGFHVLARAEELFTYPISGLIAPDKKIREKPDEIKRLIRAGIKANRYIKENREGTIQVLIAMYKLPREIAAASYDSLLKGLNSDGSLPVDGFQTLLEDTKRLAKLDREVSLNDVADLSILKQAQRELGPAR
ncbi:MAG: ABC transporter substrate-binding protein [Candidatus Binatia bacterium]